ncbi:L-glutamyl-[BtrI acyl-carrier protein] decarboxylase [compost metagenome]
MAGPLCTPLDYYVANDNLSNVAAGDLLCIPNVGAYGLTASLIGFLSREAPLEVICDGEEVISTSKLNLIRDYERVSVP